MNILRKTTLLLMAVALSATLFSGCGYNEIQTMDEEINNKWAQVENQLQRRSELIPNLVKVVKSYAAHERETLEAVTAARSGMNTALQSGEPGRIAQAEGDFNRALSRLMVVVEKYPNLKADQQYTRLMDELAGTENRVTVARMDYNNAVRDYNSYIRQFPQTLTANIIGAEKREYYDPPAETQEAVEIDM